MWNSGVIAWLYDRQLVLERSAILAALELAALRETDRLLDVATGTGALLRELRGLPQRPKEAVGLDSSRAMLARVPHLPSRWRLVHADARAIPFPDERFDVVMAIHLLHLLDATARAAVLSEARRVLRPGGRMVAVTVHPRMVLLRRLLARTPRRLGLRPLDPRPELAGCGLTVRAARHTAGGYPSLCVEAAVVASSRCAPPGG